MLVLDTSIGQPHPALASGARATASGGAGGAQPGEHPTVDAGQPREDQRHAGEGRRAEALAQQYDPEKGKRPAAAVQPA
jgi:hypothetical protein